LSGVILAITAVDSKVEERNIWVISFEFMVELKVSMADEERKRKMV